MADPSEPGWKPPPPEAGPPRTSRPPGAPTGPNDPATPSPAGSSSSAPPPAAAPEVEAPSSGTSPGEALASTPGPAAPPQGDAPGPGWFGRAAAAGHVPTDREREHAFYAHVAAAALAFLSCSLVFPILAPVAVYALVKDKTPFVLFHIHQSLIFQAACSAAQILITATGTLSSFFCVGWALYLLGLVPWLAGSIYALVVGLWARNGEWRGYAVITDKLLHDWKPFL
jgi:uncharacterized Tic20 family protein